ncbi:hypothetical protein JWG45_16570 [Leptospira sp. 201903070]|uniref:Uncharacterized protein n=1 Tax=Leptospira ainlahdjerensis TaxID=2810033 RepID=A0ABS2UEF6_9LEPT|nr:hypothetical protein [Leptospira ainlahdjerensis]MBM9578761.1 hypothetical protein [Leptospira ainlahdjerensis]
MGKLTVRCPRCYESFLFDPDSTGQYKSGYFETDSKANSPYRKTSLESYWENLKHSFSGFKTKFRNMGSLGQTPGKRFARNLLLFLLAIGIVRTCFFSPFHEVPNSGPIPNSSQEPQESPTPEPSVPNPPTESEPNPKFQI